MSKPHTREHFLEVAHSVHGDRYDYSKVVYSNARTHIKIICKVHGEFSQVPHSHISGMGCAKCATEQARTRMALGEDLFIIKAREIHGDKYSYTDVLYVNARKNVSIICPIHGIFLQTPDNHLHGQGCPKCKGVTLHNLQVKDVGKFIQEAIAVHGDTYDYSRVIYRTAKKNVEIICPKHGIFEQTPDRHIRGHGCALCGASKGERAIAQYLDMYGVHYVREIQYKDCQYKKPLFFDFALLGEDEAVKCCIEYDGIQHYKEVGFYGGATAFIKNKIRDSIKDTFCKDSGIPLYRIPYWELPNIRTVLDSILESMRIYKKY